MMEVSLGYVRGGEKTLIRGRLRFTLPKWSWLLLYGIAIELLQTQIPNRVFSVGDIVANTAGITLYAFGGMHLLQRLGWR